MSNTELLNGKVVSDAILHDLKNIVANMNGCGQSIRLAVVRVGDDAASSVYIKKKIEACKYVGIDCRVVSLPETVTQDDVLKTINNINYDESITGIIVQLPLPPHLDAVTITQAVRYSKDVDGFTYLCAGATFLGNSSFVPCTPLGILNLLKHHDIEIAGKECVVVGRSNIVGKPMAMLLLQNDGTVTMCHSKTQNLKEVCKRADILICAIGRPKFFNHEYVKEGAVVVDVGIHRQENGKLCGDVDFDDVKEHVSAITPVPNGVGPMTVAMLMWNCVLAAKYQSEPTL